jgi:ElaA protein
VVVYVANILCVDWLSKGAPMTCDQTLLWQDVHQTHLSVPQLYAALRLRSEIFVVEQQCAYQDVDGADLQGDNRHLFCWQGESLLAYARLLFLTPQQVAIGRVIVAPCARGHGLAQQLMVRALHCCQHHWPAAEIVLAAQAHLQHFYRRLGFVACGEPYDEDGILHIAMCYQPQSVAE